MGRDSQFARARIRDMYTPNSRIQALRRIEERPADAKALRCSVCGHTIMSSWFFAVQKRQELRVLKPSNGHWACKQPNGTTAHYVAVDGARSINDFLEAVDYCDHGRQRTGCR